jgi:hypothetical protein
MVKRSIRLKEFIPNKLNIHTPSDNFLAEKSGLNPNRCYITEIDHDGFIVSHPRVTNLPKIILMGDSSIENKYCDVSCRVQNLLQYKILRAGYSYEVINSGYSGANLLHLLNVFLNKIVKYESARVVLFAPSNDLNALEAESLYWSNDKFTGNMYPVQEVVSKLQSSSTNKGLATYEKVLRCICEVAKIFNIDLMLGGVISKSRTKYSRFDQLFKNVASEYALSFIDFGGVSDFDKVYDRGFYDWLHLNELGSAVLGDVLFNSIVLDCKKSFSKHLGLLRIEHSGNETEVKLNSCLDGMGLSVHSFEKDLYLTLPKIPGERSCQLLYSIYSDTIKDLDGLSGLDYSIEWIF